VDSILTSAKVFFEASRSAGPDTNQDYILEQLTETILAVFLQRRDFILLACSSSPEI
jgi:hypothetical protein